MTRTEQVTDYKLEGSVKRLMGELNVHLAACGIEPEDRGFGVNGELDLKSIERDVRWYIAFAVEGDSEGYYIHVGVMTRNVAETPESIKRGIHFREYIDLGHAKCYSADQAYQIAREAQRFLTAACWN